MRSKIRFSYLLFVILTGIYILLNKTGLINDTSTKLSSVGNSEQAIKETATVSRVVDGDTIKAIIQGKEDTVRLIGIDAPETVDPEKTAQCFGKKSSDKAKEMLTDKAIVLESDSTQGNRDEYGRLLRYVFLQDGTNFNEFMISEGYAYEYTFKNNPYKYQSEFKGAEEIAQENKKGIWSDGACRF